MSSAAKCGYLAIGFVAIGMAGCSKQNVRLITKIDVDASVKGEIPWQPQDGRVITVWTDPKDSSMSTLYGNDLAVEFARSTDRTVYPAGEAIALVTWRQKEDERWFGASVPAVVQSAEFITVTLTPEHMPQYRYQRFSGSPLRQSVAEQMSTPHGRVEYLLSQRAASMP